MASSDSKMVTVVVVPEKEKRKEVKKAENLVQKDRKRQVLCYLQVHQMPDDEQKELDYDEGQSY
jgi:hypothetical protein